MALSRDAIEAIVNEHYNEYDEQIDPTEERLFALLVDVGKAYVARMQEAHRIDPEDPDSYKPHTLNGISYIDATVMGLKENLELDRSLS